MTRTAAGTTHELDHATQILLADHKVSNRRIGPSIPIQAIDPLAVNVAVFAPQPQIHTPIAMAAFRRSDLLDTHSQRCAVLRLARTKLGCQVERFQTDPRPDFGTWSMARRGYDVASGIGVAIAAPTPARRSLGERRRSGRRGAQRWRKQRRRTRHETAIEWRHVAAPVVERVHRPGVSRSRPDEHDRRAPP
jgi:hypothetical protein